MSSSNEIITDAVSILNNINVTIHELKSIESLQLNDDVPKIQFESSCIEFQIASKTNPVSYLDSKGYTETPYNNECSYASKFETAIEEGNGFISFLYSYRSVSKAIPEVVIDGDNSRDSNGNNTTLTSTAINESILLKQAEIDAKIIDILSSGIQTLQDLSAYILISSDLLFQYFTSIGYNHKSVLDPQPSESILLLVIQLMDTLIVIENIKDKKGAFVQDFIRYKKSLGTNISPETMDGMNQITSFLMNPDPKKSRNYIFHTMKEYIKRVVGYEDILITLSDVCIKQVEEENYVLPEQYLPCLRLLPYLMVLLDGSADDLKSVNIFQHKRVKLNIIMKIMKKYPVVPICGDFSLLLVTVLELAPHYNKIQMSSTWSDSLESKYVQQEYGLNKYWKSMREEHIKHIVSFQLLINKIHISQESSSSFSSSSTITGAGNNNTAAAAAANTVFPPVFQKTLDPKYLEFASQVYTTVFQGMKALGKWKFIMTQIMAYKYSKYSNCHAIGGYSSLASNAAANNFSGGMPGDRKSTMTTGAFGGRTSSTVSGNGSPVHSQPPPASSAGSGVSGAPARNLNQSLTRFSSMSFAGNNSNHSAPGAMGGGSGSRSDSAAAQSALHLSQSTKASQESAATEGYEYDQAIKSSFTKEELSLLVDMICMIKSLSSLLLSYESILAPILRYHMHHTIQQLVLGDLLPLLHRVDKRNKSSDLQHLLHLRTLCADWINGLDPGTTDYKEYSRKLGVVVIKHPPRVVSASPTQLYLLRAYLKHISHESAPLRQKKSMLSSAEMETIDVKNFEQFYDVSYYFHDLLNMSYTLRNISDFSMLWYREQFLEITKCIQFPIDLSLPWILMEHLLLNKDTQADVPMIENICYILDIYNDATQKSLYIYNQQYLYDEVEAEANLVMDQVIFILSDDIYSYYKSIASTSTVDKALKHKLEELKQSPHLTVSNRRYELLGQQRHVRLLGRTVNFNYLIGQHILKKLTRDMEMAIKKFESCSIEIGLLEFKNVLLMFKRMYTHLIQVYEGLDGFNAILNDIDDSIVTSNYHGRIATHILRSITQDIFSNYSYNYYTQRFIKSPIPIRLIEYSKPPKNASLHMLYGSASFKVFEMTAKQCKGFFGKLHYEALIEIGQYFEISTLIIECLSYLTIKIKDSADYIEALADGITPIKLPKYNLKATGNYAFFENKLKTILEYDDLKPEVFQVFREIGNVIAFLKDLSDVVDIYDQSRYITSASLLSDTLSGLNAILNNNNNNSNNSNGRNNHSNLLVSNSKDTTTNNNNNGPPFYNSPNSTVEISEESLAQSPIGNVLLSVSDTADHLSETQPQKILKLFRNNTSILTQFPEVVNSMITALTNNTSPMSHNTIFQFTLQQIRDTMIHFDLNKVWESHHMNFDEFYQYDDDNNNTGGGNTASHSIKLNCHRTPYKSIETENAKGFHKIWSALSFLFCMPEEEGKAPTMLAPPPPSGVTQQQSKTVPQQLVPRMITDEAEFGHGFAIAGVLFVHLLGQRMPYELMDYSYHVLAVHSHDTLTGTHPTAASGTSGIPVKPNKQLSSTVTTTQSALDHASQKITDPRIVKAVDAFVIIANEQKQLQTELFHLFASKLPVDHEIIKVVSDDVESTSSKLSNVDKFSRRHVAVDLELSHGFVLYHPPPLNEIV